MTNVDRKIASSDTIRVSVGHGLFSKTSIHVANRTTWRYTKFIEPANAVIWSAIRSCTSAARFWNCVTTTGWCTTLGSSLGMVTSLSTRSGSVEPTDALGARAAPGSAARRGTRPQMLVGDDAEGRAERDLCRPRHAPQPGGVGPGRSDTDDGS